MAVIIIPIIVSTCALDDMATWLAFYLLSVAMVGRFRTFVAFGTVVRFRFQYQLPRKAQKGEQTEGQKLQLIA